jgi:hypothetical protein
MKSENKKHIPENKKENNKITLSDIEKLNEDIENTLEEIIDKTEIKNRALNKIIKSFRND